MRNGSTGLSRSVAAVVATLAVAGAGLGVAGCCSRPGAVRGAPLPVVSRVDLQRYQGTWYELARYPTRFQRGCEAVTATYSPRPDGRIRVVNRCRKGSPDGPERSVEGVAWSVDPATNAKLKVRFFWPFCGDYWVLMLGSTYEYAVVGTPSRGYLWILAREPRLSEATWVLVRQRLRELGYDPARLRMTRHRAPGP